jgi:tetratricopeptide (TPR) repeat protein
MRLNAPLTRYSVVVVLGALGCSSAKNPSPSTGAQPANAAATTSCPDDTDTPQILEYTIGVGYRAFQQNPANVLPSCFVAAIARNDKAYGDSTITMTLAISDALLAANPNDAVNLSGRLALLNRARRYREVPATFDKLIRRDTSKATLANYRLALAAAMRGGDTTSRLRYLTAASRRFPRQASIVADYNIQRQVPRLHALIDSTQRILRLDPRRATAYATLASIYGNLDVPDSALAYTRRALAGGVARSDVAPSLQSLIGVVMRKAQLFDDRETWSATLPVARAIDTTLSTDASKHLIALTLTELAGANLAGARPVIAAAEAASANAMRADAGSRNAACRSVADTRPMIDEAERRLAAGGSRFSPESSAGMRNSLTILRQELAALSRKCSG